MDALPYLLPLAAGLLAVVAWLLTGRRPPPAPRLPTVLDVAGDASAHRLEVARDEHAATVAEVESRAGLSSADRLRAAEEAAARRRR